MIDAMERLHTFRICYQVYAEHYRRGAKDCEWRLAQARKCADLAERQLRIFENGYRMVLEIRGRKK